MAAVRKPRDTTTTRDARSEAVAGEEPPEPSLRAATREYFALLETQLKGYRAYNDHGRWWSTASMDGSTRRRHHGHISAILLDQGLPYARNRPPLPSRSPALRRIVADYLRNHPEVFTHMETAVFRREPRREFSSDELTNALIRRPPPYPGNPASLDADLLIGADYLAGEQRNRSLAHAGECFVLAFEQLRLARRGQQKFADAIEHASTDTGDRAGHDIQSWDDNGDPLLIRVKTTRFGPETPFYLSTQELALARSHGARYAVYRVFDYPERPRLFIVNGPLEAHTQLEAVTYRTTIR